MRFAFYTFLVCASLVLVLNPAVVAIFAPLRKIHVLYLLIFDIIIISICIACVLHIITKRARYFVISIVLLAILPLAMALTEFGLVYARLTLGPKGLQVIENVHRPDPVQGWSLIPSNTGRHKLDGNFDVLYEFDGFGRKVMTQHMENRRTLHFFGNSFIFGMGVSNDQTALSLLSKKIGPQVNILNYGVMGYGLEQMFHSLRSNLQNIKMGDTVIFSPISNDLLRNHLYRDHYCSFKFRSKDGFRVDKLPAYINDQWTYFDIEKYCYLSDVLFYSDRMPLGAIYRWYHKELTYDAIVENADKIFAQAARLTEQRGAKFFVVFLTTPRECQTQSFEFKLEGLKTNFMSLMPYCPTDEEDLERLSLPTDPHWSSFGNQWAALALEKLLHTEMVAAEVGGPGG